MDHKKVMTSVAARLAGRPVEVRLRAPFIAEASGLALRNGGMAYVDIDPSQGEAEVLKTFLHELAHVRRDFASIPDCDTNDAPGSSHYTAAGLKAAVNDPREPGARTLAGGWLDYAEKYAWVFSGGYIASRLRALEFWPAPLIEEKQIDQFIDDTVQKAVKAALKPWLKTEGDR